jgi:phenylacetate-CoA ligase
VLTTLTKEALPLVRYRTGDITRLMPGDCACGRTGVRMAKPSGRTDDMLIIRGVNVFPSQVETVLVEMAETEPHYRLTVSREGAMDRLAVEVEVKAALYSSWRDEMRPLGEKIRRRLGDILGISAEVRIVAPKTLPRTEGKARHVEDRRGD